MYSDRFHLTIANCKYSRLSNLSRPSRPTKSWLKFEVNYIIRLRPSIILLVPFDVDDFGDDNIGN